MKLLLEVSITEVLTQTHILVAIGLAALGITLSVLAKKITRIIRKTDEISEDDIVLVSTKVLALVFILVALVFVAYNGGN